MFPDFIFCIIALLLLMIVIILLMTNSLLHNINEAICNTEIIKVKGDIEEEN